MKTPSKCKYCGDSFQDNELLLLHIQARHPERRPAAPDIANDAISKDLATNVQTPTQFLTFLSGVMQDVVAGKLGTDRARVVCLVSKEMLKMMELAWRIRQAEHENGL